MDDHEYASWAQGHIDYLESRVEELERDVQVYWDAAKHAEELLALIHEKLSRGHNREALDLLEQGGE